MDTLSPNNCSKSNSSGSSATSSSMDLGDKPSKQSKQRQRGQKLSRSRSLLQLLSKHLGRHFQHHHHQNDTVYSSQDDIRSSSTDSFSLSYERGSRNECLEEALHGGSSLDLENTSRTSSASYSPGLEFYDNNTHIYVETVYRPGSAMEQLQPHYDDNSSVEDDEDCEEEEHVDENENLKPHSNEPQPRSASAASAGNTSKGGLHLSRISISSSVSRMLQHFSTSAATTATASLRSLSCSSTPLRQLRAHRAVSSTTTSKKSLTPHGSSNSSSSNSSNSSCSSSNSHSHSSNNSASKSTKKDKKQQSILRPPVQYVYMKGMSGLYSRVPSYAVCCPYTLHHMY
ncbi:hypothetical protein KR044_007949 [Drosophila immigrans]|nr:hypothetical protein KR044_007949 [Drosophila immigrans]